MKKEIMFKRILSLIVVAVITFFCSITAFAVDLDGDGIDDDEPVYTEAPTEYVEPEPVETEPQTEYVAPAPVVQETTEFQAPTLAKTVSDKQYSTSYTAGIVSWICVAVGVIVVAAVLISTKVGGKKI